MYSNPNVCYNDDAADLTQSTEEPLKGGLQRERGGRERQEEKRNDIPIPSQPLRREQENVRYYYAPDLTVIPEY